MNRAIAFLLTPLALAAAADRFEVASVKPVDRPTNIRRRSPGRIRYEGIPFPELIEKAFEVSEYQVIWPEWLPFVRRDHLPKETLVYRYFDIDATMPPETAAPEFRLMLQNLLADRFGLAVHRETRPFAQYELTFPEGGPKMAKAKAVPDSVSQGLPDDLEDAARIQHFYNQKTIFNKETGIEMIGDYTVAGLAEFFSHYLPHPMADRTGSQDYYTVDFTWGWDPASQPAVRGMWSTASDREARELCAAMEKRLGVRATLRTAPAEFLVIDRLRPDPTEN